MLLEVLSASDCFARTGEDASNIHRAGCTADFIAINAFPYDSKPPQRRWRRFARPVVINGVRSIVRRIGADIHPVHTVTLEAMVKQVAVNRNFVEVCPPVRPDLRVCKRTPCNKADRW